jgi:hypothetical protein
MLAHPPDHAHRIHLPAPPGDRRLSLVHLSCMPDVVAQEGSLKSITNRCWNCTSARGHMRTDTCRLRARSPDPLAIWSSPGSPSLDRQKALRASLKTAELVSCERRLPIACFSTEAGQHRCCIIWTSQGRPWPSFSFPDACHISRSEQATRPNSEMEPCERLFV